MADEENYKFICSEEDCGKRFKRRDRLTIHLRTHTGERPFKCKESGCSKSYCRQSHLLRHQHNAHGPPASEKTIFLCTTQGCRREFTQEHNLQKHFKRMHSSEAEHKYKCEEAGCGASFRKHHQLRAHSYSHTKVAPYTCPHPSCPRSFPTATKLHSHAKVHQGYHCDQDGCGQTFSKWTELRRHKSTDHVQDFPCEKCSKTFPKRHLLNMHVRAHHEEKAVLHCPHEGCDRVYWDKKNLRAHVSSFHEGKHFTCDLPHCAKSYTSKQKLNEHMKTHNPDYVLPAKAPEAKVKKAKKKPGRKKQSIATHLTGLCDRELERCHLFNLDLVEPAVSQDNMNLSPRQQGQPSTMSSATQQDHQHAIACSTACGVGGAIDENCGASGGGERVSVICDWENNSVSRENVSNPTTTCTSNSMDCEVATIDFAGCVGGPVSGVSMHGASCGDVSCVQQQKVITDPSIMSVDSDLESSEASGPPITLSVL